MSAGSPKKPTKTAATKKEENKTTNSAASPPKNTFSTKQTSSTSSSVLSMPVAALVSGSTSTPFYRAKEAETFLKENQENKIKASRDLSNQLEAMIQQQEGLIQQHDMSNMSNQLKAVSLNRSAGATVSQEQQLSANQRRVEDPKTELDSDLHMSLPLEQLLRNHGETKLLSRAWATDFKEALDRYEQAKQDGNHKLSSLIKSRLDRMDEEKYSQLYNLLMRATINQDFKLVQGLVDELKPYWDLRYDRLKNLSQTVVDLGGSYVPPPTSLLRETEYDFYLDIRREYNRLNKPIRFIDFALNCFESVGTSTWR